MLFNFYVRDTDFDYDTLEVIMWHDTDLCKNKVFSLRSDQKTVLFGLIRQVLTTFLSFLALSGDGEQLSRVELLVTADRGSMSQLRDSQGWSKKASGDIPPCITAP